jgi:hypothetical protein
LSLDSRLHSTQLTRLTRRSLRGASARAAEVGSSPRAAHDPDQPPSPDRPAPARTPPHCGSWPNGRGPRPTAAGGMAVEHLSARRNEHQLRDHTRTANVVPGQPPLPPEPVELQVLHTALTNTERTVVATVRAPIHHCLSLPAALAASPLIATPSVRIDKRRDLMVGPQRRRATVTLLVPTAAASTDPTDSGSGRSTTAPSPGCNDQATAPTPTVRPEFAWPPAAAVATVRLIPDDFPHPRAPATPAQRRGLLGRRPYRRLAPRKIGGGHRRLPGTMGRWST